MSLKERLLKKQVFFDKEKAESLALWIRENEQDLRDVLASNIPVRKIQVEAISDLGDKFPNDVNFETALCFSLLQLEAVKKEMPKDCIVNIPVVDTVEDLENIEKEKIKNKQAELEPFKVGNKKYYYAKFVLNNEECEIIKLSASKNAMNQYLYNKRDKTSKAYGYAVKLDILEIRFATKDELIRMGIIDAGENR